MLGIFSHVQRSGRQTSKSEVPKIEKCSVVVSISGLKVRSVSCLLVFLACATSLGACGGVVADDSPVLSQGAHPRLPLPEHSLLPTLHIAPAVGWRRSAKPVAAAGGTEVIAFAQALDHPRWLYVLPNGDVLVAESQAPAKPDDAQGIRGWVQGWFMKRAGSGAQPSANRITLLRDADGDGVADQRSTFLSGLNSPVGMALVGNRLYVAATDSLLWFSYTAGMAAITSPGVVLTTLPGGAINHHWTKTLVASRDGAKLYVGVGSNSNVAERGMEVEAERAAIWEVDARTGTHRIYASGLRNPVGLAWEADTGQLWVAVNERDELGNDLVPDYITAVREGGFYGWPYSYYGQLIDTRVQPQNPALVATATAPDYALGAHTASLGLASSAGTHLPSLFAHGMFVGQHGSWNRRPLSGYKVIFVPFTNGVPRGDPLDVLTGFLNASGDAQGRPVGLAIDRAGDLLVADDVGNTVWRVRSVVEKH